VAIENLCDRLLEHLITPERINIGALAAEEVVVNKATMLIKLLHIGKVFLIDGNAPFQNSLLVDGV
jgi:hypothetical protein